MTTKSEVWTNHPKYHNDDPRCRYLDQPIDYCWSYANHVDLAAGDRSSVLEKFRDMESICEGCEFFDKNATPSP